MMSVNFAGYQNLEGLEAFSPSIMRQVKQPPTSTWLPPGRSWPFFRMPKQTGAARRIDPSRSEGAGRARQTTFAWPVLMELVSKKMNRISVD